MNLSHHGPDRGAATRARLVRLQAPRGFRPRLGSRLRRASLLRLACLLGGLCVPAAGAEAPLFDLSREPVLYCVGYAHLDTQWRWDFRTTIDQYLRDTLLENFDRFERFPGYVFNFTGSVRYEMMKEYYPELYARLKEHVAAGRWCVSGSSVDEGDVNVPSAEATLRQVLYGNEFFRREFGKESVDFMLPDCFGFPASMPSIWAHCGLKGFSTQKLTWGSAVGIPFKVGVWKGPDGRGVIAAFDPGPYVGAIRGRVDTNPEWVARVRANGEKYGLWADYHYYGVGDQGGAPKAEDIANYLASQVAPEPAEPDAAAADAPTMTRVKVALTSSDQMFKDITPAQRARLPRYQGDLLLTEHSAGTLTSQAYMKRWNRRNECLADAAERMAVAAHWLGAAAYPREKLYRSWVRVLANQMHDILPGTSIPRAYTYSWNDEIVALNGFAAVLQDSVGAAARALDTAVAGVPLIVYNPLVIAREDLVTATVEFQQSGRGPAAVEVLDAGGQRVPAQSVRLSDAGQSYVTTFLARVAPLSLTTYTLRLVPEERVPEAAGRLLVTDRSLENEHFRITLNEAGDVASIYDKALARELLERPAQLEFTYEKPQHWPAWNMDWADRQKPPLGVVDGTPKIRIVERGPARVALEVERAARGSIIRQQIRLAAGDAGRRIEFKTEIDWQSTECALKATFPLTARNPLATYNWGLGTIERGNNEPTKYEVPAHEWIDLTDASGEFGVSILEDCKYGSDKPADHVLRLTLLYTPGVRKSYMDQHSQDWGLHEMTYALYSHAGDWRAGRTEWQARRLNQPLVAFQAPPRPGPLGRSVSLARLNTEQVDLRALKLAERSDEVIVRVQELWGRPAEEVELTIAGGIAAVREVDGQERALAPPADEPLATADPPEARPAPPSVRDGRLVFGLTPYSPRSFAVRLVPPASRLSAPISAPAELPYDVDVVSSDAEARAESSAPRGGMDAVGLCYPAEELPATITSEGIVFVLGPTDGAAPQAVTCRGQTLTLPVPRISTEDGTAGPEGFAELPDAVYLLAAATREARGTFHLNGRPLELRVQPWRGFLGQWDDRVWDTEFGEVDHICDGRVIALHNGYIQRDTWAWFATHHHVPGEGNAAYQFCYLFKYRLALTDRDLAAQAERDDPAPPRPPAPLRQLMLQLPDEPDIRIFAVTLAHNPNDHVRPAQPLYDDFSERQPVQLRYQYPPPPPPVHEGVTPLGRVEMDRREPQFGQRATDERGADETAAAEADTPERRAAEVAAAYASLLIGPPSSSDFADASTGQAVRFQVFDPDGSYRPHRGSGVRDGALPRLNDGVMARDDDDTERCIWYDNEGRFFADLGAPRQLERINAYSWHLGNRAPQRFSLWGARPDSAPDQAAPAAAPQPAPAEAAQPAPPPMDFGPGAAQPWELIAVVDTTALGQGGIHGTSVQSRLPGGALGPYRYLLWVLPDVGQGTFFTEIDIHVRE